MVRQPPRTAQPEGRHVNTGMRRTTTLQSTTDRIYDGGPTILQYNITILNHCVTIAYSIQYSNMLYRFVA